MEVERILALDPARRSGWCFAPSDAKPSDVESGSVDVLKAGEDPVRMPGKMGRWLVDRIRQHKPTMLVVEDWLDPFAQPTSNTVTLAMFAQGSILTIAGLFNLPVRHINTLTWRKHFCGRSNAMEPVKRAVSSLWSPKEKARHKAEAREANKRMVHDRAITLGYLPQDTPYQPDRSDAVGIWHYGANHYAKSAPHTLVLFD